MKLSVIIVSYNVRHYLQQCLDSLHKAMEGIDYEIFVVDNHSRDGTVMHIRRDNPDVNLIASMHNNGFARANNIAAGKSDGDFLLLINPDTFVGEHTITDCLEFMETHEKVGCLGVRMLKCDGSDAKESRRGLPSPMTAFYKISGLCARFPKSHRFGKYYMGYLSWDAPSAIEVVSGAFCMLRKDAVNQAGLLDEDFFMYGEDIDLSYRILKCGYENWYLPAKILHYKGESTHKSSFRYIHVFYGAMLIFLKKHYGHLGLWLSVPIKIAIYVKASMELVKMASGMIRKSLGFVYGKEVKTDDYVFLGRHSSLEKCRVIAERNELPSRFVECDAVSNPDGHACLIKDIQRPTYFVYDTSAYGYGDILDIFSRHSRDGVLIGTFNPERGVIITDKDVFV